VSASVEIIMAKKTMILFSKPASLLEPQDERELDLFKIA
jgi:hypothetical protein